MQNAQRTYRREGPTSEEVLADTIRHGLMLDDRMAAIESMARRLREPAAGNNGSAWSSFGEYLIAVRNAAREGPIDKRLIESRAASGLTGSDVPELGAYILPTEFSDVLLKLVYYLAPIARRTMRIPAKARSISLPAIDETSRASGSRWGGISSSWDTEADTVTATKPKFRSVELRLKRLLSLIYATSELAEDASALGTFIANAFAAEAAYQLDDGIVNGIGGSVQLLGILNSPGLITVAKQPGQAAASIVSQNLLDMFSRLLPECLPNAVWLVSPELFAAMFAVNIPTTTTAVSVTQLLTPPDADAPFGRLLTRPIIPVEQVSALGTVGDVILADLSRYAIYERPLDLRMSMDVRFVNHEAVYRMRYRVDGQPIVKSPIVPKNGGPTKSAYVALATR